MKRQDLIDVIAALSIFWIITSAFNVIGHAYDMSLILALLVSGGSGHVLVTATRNRRRSRRNR